MKIMKCGHGAGEYICDLDKGHSGNHRRTKEIKRNLFPGESEFTIHEWNDEGYTPLPEHGDSFQCDYDDAEDCRHTKELAIFAARRYLTPGVVFEIRAKLYPEDRTTDYGTKKITRDEAAKDWGIAWYLVPKQPKGFEHLETATEPLVDYEYDQGEHIEAGGYILLARIKA